MPADTPLVSNFADDLSLDTESTLYVGDGAVSTTLAEDLSDTEEDLMLVIDATYAPHAGIVVIDGIETISYSSRTNQDMIKGLIRGIAGTTAVSHLAGVTIVFYPPYGALEALRDAVLSMQSMLLDHKNRIETLETP